ncbi:MAG: universal stress protein, partial [Rhodothermaceae bacterium]|nr:universal stress protein [Rhodothermaceae bacterium]
RPSEEHPEVEVQRILVPVDFSPHAWLAAAHAKELAALFHARLCLLHVLEVLPPIGLADLPPQLPSAQEQADARHALLDLCKEAGGPEVPVDATVVAGHPTLDVIEVTRQLDIDLLVMATHGRTGLERVLLGSVTERAIQQAPCPVFVVKAFGKSLLRPAERSAAYPEDY